MAAVESPVPAAVTESKSARKKKAKAEAAAAANGTEQTTPALPDTTSKDNSVMAEADSTSEHPYIKELQKQIRNINKKLGTMHKLDAILAEHPGVSLDDLVAQRKINNDQRAAAQKKPQLMAQLADLEERQEHYRKFDTDYQAKFNKQRDDLTSQHQQQMDKLKEELRVEAISASSAELRKKLLIFSQFLRAAAAKRGEEAQDTEDSQAFEGALLLVYGGDQKAVDTAVNLIEGTDLPVPSVEGILTSVTFKQVKQAAVTHAPYQAEEAWVDQVAEATAAGDGLAEADSSLPTSDPTITHAGLTEIDDGAQTNGAVEIGESASVAPISAGDVGNTAGERWDTGAAGAGAEQNGLEDSYEIIPRASEEVDVPVEAATTTDTSVQPQSTSWADESTREAATGIGNAAGSTWDRKAPGDAEAAGSVPASATPVVNDDGFSQVQGRQRGRGGPRGGRGDGEGRGRGRGRGRGEFRGGRGDGEHRGRGGYRGNRGDGEFRGGRGGGRGRGGSRGGGDAGAQS